MLLAGDEVGASQQGNNNAYCQDNPISWIDWQARAADRALERFVAALLALRAAEPVLRRGRHLHGEVRSPRTGLPDASWLNARGEPMERDDWHDESAFLALQLVGEAVLEGVEEPGATLLLLFNGGPRTVRFPLDGEALEAGPWHGVIDTAAAPDEAQAGAPDGGADGQTDGETDGEADVAEGGAMDDVDVTGARAVVVEARSVRVLRCGAHAS